MVMAPISITLVQMVTWRLLKWSASQPPVMLKSTKGMEKRKVTIATKVSRSSLPRPMPTTMAKQQVAQDVVAVCALELGRDQTPRSRARCALTQMCEALRQLRDRQMAWLASAK